MSDDELSKIKKLICNYVSSLPKLTILVFGPGQYNRDPYNKKCYGKRVDIRGALAKDHYALFFEKICKEAEREGKDISNILGFEEHVSKDKEVDIVLMIFVINAPGLQAELVLCSKCPEIAEKMLIFYDNYYYKFGDEQFWYINDSLKLIAANNGRIEPFEKEEIDSCSLLSRVKESIEQRRIAISLLPYKKYQGVE